MLLISINDLLSLKSNVMVPLRCDTCYKQFNKLQKYVKHELKSCPSKKDYCDKQCQSISQLGAPIDIFCAYCQRIFQLEQHDFDKRRDNFSLCCSLACANKFNNHRSNDRKIKTSKMIAELRKLKHENEIKNAKNTIFYRGKMRVADKQNICIICSKTFFHCHFRKICSPKCNSLLSKRSGNKGGSTTSSLSFHKRARSSNEKLLFSKVLEIYPDTISNKRMFDGWDADIIIPSLKLAIHWNGPWHYKSIMGDELLERVKLKDQLRYKAIETCGYSNYIIQDLGKMDHVKVELEFTQLIKYIKEQKVGGPART